MDEFVVYEESDSYTVMSDCVEDDGQFYFVTRHDGQTFETPVYGAYKAALIHLNLFFLAKHRPELMSSLDHLTCSNFGFEQAGCDVLRFGVKQYTRASESDANYCVMNEIAEKRESHRERTVMMYSPMSAVEFAYSKAHLEYL